MSFTKALQGMDVTLDRPYTRAEALGTGLAFIRDPWGT